MLKKTLPAILHESVIMEITGHSTREMFDRYNTVDQDGKRAMKRLQEYLANYDYKILWQARRPLQTFD